VRYIAGDVLSDFTAGRTYPLSGTFSEEIMRTRSSILIDEKNIDVIKEKFRGRQATLLSGTSSAVVTPLISDNDLIGVLALHSTGEYVYTKADQMLTEKIGNQIAGAIANAELHAERNALSKKLELQNQQLETLVNDRTCELYAANLQLHQEIKKCEETEESLIKQQADTEEKAKALEELNTALKVILQKREDDRNDLEERIMLSVNQLVTPYIEGLKEKDIDAKVKSYIGIIETGIKEITAPFLMKLSVNYRNLTPREVQVANLVREGKNTVCL
ncbi:MAG: GAF domain-containing protein, partial [Syntrophales bacterium LBB04]|nr:GAF domain-containing protein [Syntrophales bacterium LBB04]